MPVSVATQTESSHHFIEVISILKNTGEIASTQADIKENDDTAPLSFTAVAVDEDAAKRLLTDLVSIDQNNPKTRRKILLG